MPLKRASTTTNRIARTHAQNMVTIGLLALCLAPTLNPQISGKNWLYMMTQSTAP
ncbi:unnamed protein product [Periconia digitata]|uniref:Uncharacterized protein n=1 Tax=Periconia digitata TaxID=1303443 RepID=A0A9W4XSH0_9PLEO|nr:unnamed protein product [Periconia digitata]